MGSPHFTHHSRRPAGSGGGRPGQGRGSFRYRQTPSNTVSHTVTYCQILFQTLLNTIKYGCKHSQTVSQTIPNFQIPQSMLLCTAMLQKISPSANRRTPITSPWNNSTSSLDFSEVCPSRCKEHQLKPNPSCLSTPVAFSMRKQRNK